MDDPRPCDCRLKNWNNGLEDDKVQCTVLFFAAAADAAGCNEQTMRLHLGTTASDLFDELATNSGALAPLKKTCAVAIDQQLVPWSTQISAGCTVAFLPPVSGG